MSSRILGSLLLGAAVVFASACSWTRESRSDEILFVRETDAGAAIYLMSDDGREVRRLVEGTSPRWSPDGRRFAYVVDDEETRYCGTSVWVMNPDTGTRRRLEQLESGLLVCSLAWAPDGVRLVYSNGFQVVAVNTQTGDRAAVSLDLPIDGPMDWSPDGRELILSYALFSSKVLDTRTGAERAFGRKPSAGDGKWSPDGRRIALAVSSPLTKARIRRVIVVADRAGGNREQVTRGAFDSGPAWSPDGKRIYFSRQRAVLFGDDQSHMEEIYAIDLETRELRRLTKNNVVDRSPDVRPDDRELPPVPAPIAGDVVVPDLAGRYVLLDHERGRFRKLGLTLQAVPTLFPEDGVLSVIHEQVPSGGARVPRSTVVKVSGSDLGGPLTSRRRFSAPIWRSHPGCAGTREWRRFEMYGDLVRRVLRRGMTRERVVSLLGKPQRSERRWSDWALTRSPILHTELVCVYLRVEFNHKGRTASFHQWAR